MLVPPRYFHAALAASIDPARENLRVLRLERLADGKVCATATDGKMLVHCEWKEPSADEYPQRDGLSPLPGPAPFIVSLDARDLASLAKLTPARCGRPILENVVIDENSIKMGRIEVGTTDLETDRRATVHVCTDAYPNYRANLEKLAPSSRALTLRLDLPRLHKLLGILLKIHPEDRKGAETRTVDLTIDISISGAPGPLTVNVCGSETSAIVMPLTMRKEKGEEP